MTQKSVPIEFGGCHHVDRAPQDAGDVLIQAEDIDNRAAGIEFDEQIQVGSGSIFSTRDGAEYPCADDRIPSQDLGELCTVSVQQFAGAHRIHEARVETEAGGGEDALEHGDGGLPAP